MIQRPHVLNLSHKIMFTLWKMPLDLCYEILIVNLCRAPLINCCYTDMQRPLVGFITTRASWVQESEKGIHIFSSFREYLSPTTNAYR